MSEVSIEIPLADWYDLGLHPIFARCLRDAEGDKFDFSRPFVIEEYVYATDGRILVRMPTPQGWSLPNPAKAPPPARVLDIFGQDDWSRRPWQSRPTEFPPVEGVCKVCAGAKVLPELPCPYCGGRAAPRYDRVTDLCEECWSLDGKIPAGPCYGCDGSGILDAGKRIEVVLGYWVQRRYVALLHEFGMTTYLPVTLDKMHPMRFTQGDVVGVLMPMTSPKEGA